MNKKIYFAGSIRGGRADASLYAEIIAHINKTDRVLTEHVGDMNLSVTESRETDGDIYRRDMEMLRESDMVVAECTCPSLGVGYELATAEHLGKPVYIFYNHRKAELSAMLTGDSYFRIYSYTDREQLFRKLDEILTQKEFR